MYMNEVRIYIAIGMDNWICFIVTYGHCTEVRIYFKDMH